MIGVKSYLLLIRKINLSSCQHEFEHLNKTTIDISNIVTGDIKIPQVLLNRVPEQITVDNVWYQNLLLKINFRVEITIFTQCDKV